MTRGIIKVMATLAITAVWGMSRDCPLTSLNEYPGNTLPGTQEFDSSTLLKKTSQDFYWQK